MKKLQFAKVEYDRYACTDDRNLRLCSEGVEFVGQANEVKRTTQRIQISVANKNQKKKGWVKCRYLEGGAMDIFMNGNRYCIGILSRADEWLIENDFDDEETPFWIKVVPLNK